MKSLALITCLAAILVSGCRPQTEPAAAGKASQMTTDPLPSWNDGKVKSAIIDYVHKVTDSSSGSYIPVADRIASFDNDGTLWAEKPLVQELFAFAQAREMVTKDGRLAKKQPFKAVIEGDKEYFHKGGEKAFVQLVDATHTGMTEVEFENAVKNFFTSATYPPRNVPIWQITYQPQIELLNYLRANGFKTYICSGGTVEFVRGISMDLYGIPKEQVVGTTFNYKYVDSSRSIMRLPGLAHFNDKEGKPVTLQRYLGRPPVFACGNEGGEGDVEMLQFSQSSKYPSLQLLVNHDDSTREYYYQEKTNWSLDEAAKNNWQVISIKHDWKNVYRAEKR
ncbi:HAD family hydrolase [Polluticoccus soli]|uniref:HAD family hydrolase n=1 Tax=Polluticoccus soli TaxID=3034150 RepID=UPI0023E26FEA|nr:HAD family hydrolase [Flavipsychrobacter sp. JY13-12]